jgi:glycosyltransferase involved in cell wall biosynthesis
MPTSVLVSVYIPTRNRATRLGIAIESVLRQTYSDIEVIVVDDNSTDDTSDLLESLSKQEARLRFVVNTESKGAPTARNQAIRLAQGRFVTGLDDDDRFQPDRVRSFVERWLALEEQGIRPSCLYSQDIIQSADGRSRITIKPDHARYEDLFKHNCIGNQVFAPKEHFISAGLFDELLPAWQDLELFMRIAALLGPAFLVNSPSQIVDNTPRNNRISTVPRDRVLEAYRLVAEKHATTPRQRQQLLLQIFSPYYRLRPTTDDWHAFLSEGVWPYGIARLMQATFRFR